MTEAHFNAQFSDIDAASNPTDYVHYMDDANAMEFFRAAKQRTYDALALRAGDHVLDIGCGAGDDVRAMWERVGPTGRSVGLDRSKTMIDAARDRSSDSRVEFVVGDAEHLDFADESFDACRADRVLLHLSDPRQAVSEMARVLRPNGRLVAFEPDTGGLLIDAPDRQVTRRIVDFRGDLVRSGWIGRQLPRLMKHAGLLDVDVTVLPSPRTEYAHTNATLHLTSYADRAAEAGVITTRQATDWSDSLASAAASGYFFCVVTMFMVVGRKTA